MIDLWGFGLWHPGPGLNAFLDTYATAVLLFAAIPATVFPIAYSRRPWYSTWIGRALMVKATGLALLIDVSILYALFGDDYPYRNVVRAVIYTIVVIGITLQCVVLLRTPQERALDERNDPDHSNRRWPE